MATEFSVQNEPFPNLYWATCSWNMGAALFPLIFVPLTENTGRMPGYFVSHADSKHAFSLTDCMHRGRISSLKFFFSRQRLPRTSQLLLSRDLLEVEPHRCLSTLLADLSVMCGKVTKREVYQCHCLALPVWLGLLLVPSLDPPFKQSISRTLGVGTSVFTWLNDNAYRLLTGSITSR